MNTPSERPLTDTGGDLDDFEPILTFWLGELDGDGCADDTHATRWWKKDPEFDQLIRDLFFTDFLAIASGKCEGWLETVRGRLASVIVLDQFSRSVRFAIMHRDIIRQFGRFPHRNKILGRQSTPAERDFLKQPNSSF